MASSLLLLLDDIASVLDDVALLTKAAAKKAAGVLGDDLALNAQQVTGVRADRELPVVWAVAKGSLVNKAILVPAALAIGAWLPWAVMPLLMAGGAFLCFEGVEKLAHTFLHRNARAAERERLAQAVAEGQVDLPAIERQKIKGAIRTDFILSAEIIVITLGTVGRRGRCPNPPSSPLFCSLFSQNPYQLLRRGTRRRRCASTTCARADAKGWLAGLHEQSTTANPRG